VKGSKKRDSWVPLKKEDLSYWQERKGGKAGELPKAPKGSQSEEMRKLYNTDLKEPDTAILRKGEGSRGRLVQLSKEKEAAPRL